EEDPVTAKTSIDRRRFLGSAAATLPSAELELPRSPPARSQPPNKTSPAKTAHASFGPVKQIDAGALNVGYVEAGPASGPPVFLLHGRTYHLHALVRAAPTLVAV